MLFSLRSFEHTTPQHASQPSVLLTVNLGSVHQDQNGPKRFESPKFSARIWHSLTSATGANFELHDVSTVHPHVAARPDCDQQRVGSCEYAIQHLLTICVRNPFGSCQGPLRPCGAQWSLFSTATRNISPRSISVRNAFLRHRRKDRHQG